MGETRPQKRLQTNQPVIHGSDCRVYLVPSLSVIFVENQSGYCIAKVVLEFVPYNAFKQDWSLPGNINPSRIYIATGCRSSGSEPSARYNMGAHRADGLNCQGHHFIGGADLDGRPHS